jgi:hypothetical protein
VVLSGLSTTTLNGALGVCGAFNVVTGRYTITLESQGQRQVSIKRASAQKRGQEDMDPCVVCLRESPRRAVFGHAEFAEIAPGVRSYSIQLLFFFHSIA